MPELPPNIVICGPTSSGKSTAARRIALATGRRHIELDALFHGPNWTPTATPEFRAAVLAATDRPGWVADGNYRQIIDLTWGRADLVIWLDYPLPLTLWRLNQRTLRRWRNREVLWNGNREDMRTHLFTKESLYYWAITTHHRHRRDYPERFREVGVKRVVRVRRPRALEVYLREHAV